MTTPSSERAAENRAAFPVSAQMLDAFRALFGPGCKLRYAQEGGRSIGKPGRKGIVPIDLPPPPEDQAAAPFSARKNGRARMNATKGRAR